MRRTPIVVSLLLVVALASSCGEDPSAPPPASDPPLLEIRVSDTAGTPLVGVDVSLWNGLPCWLLQDDSHGCTGGNPPTARREARRARTSLRFEVAERSDVALLAFDLEGELEEVIFEGVLEAGSHSFQWGAETPGTTVHRIQLEIRDLESGRVRLSDSIFAVQAKTGFADCHLGSTDEGGIFEVLESALVPGLADGLPLIPVVDESGRSHGEFALEAIVFVELRSADGSRCQLFELDLRNGQRIFDLVFDARDCTVPPAASGIVAPAGIESHAALPIPGRDRLYQNAPNPFN